MNKAQELTNQIKVIPGNFLNSLLQFLRRFAGLLFDPIKTYQNSAQKEKARLLSVFIFITFLLYVGADLISYQPNNLILYYLGYGLIIATFIINRNIHYLISSRLATYLVPYLIFSTVYSESARGPVAILYFLVLGLIMGSFLVRKTGLVLLGLINLLGILCLPVTVPGLGLDYLSVLAPLFINLIATILITFKMNHNERLMKIQQYTLSGSSDHFSSIFYDSPLGILIAGNGSRLINANQAACDLLGYSVDEIIGEKIPSLTHPDDHARTLEMFWKVVAAEIPSFSMEVRFLKKSGDAVWVNLNSTLVFEDTGIPIYGIAIIEDITEQKRTTEALELEKEKAQTYLDNAGVLFMALDTQGQITLINQKGCEILGSTQEEILGRNWFDEFMSQDEKARTQPLFERIMRGELVQVDQFENRIISSSGDERILSWHNTTLMRDNEIIGNFSVGEDITDRMKLDNALRASENRYRTLFEFSADAISIHDGPSILDVNETWLKMFGYQEDEIIGKTPFDFSPELQPDGMDSESKGLGFLAQVSRENNVAFEWRYTRSDGSEFDVEILMSIIEVGGKDVHISFLRDITERKAAEEDMRRRLDELDILQKVSSICLEGNDEDGVIMQITDLIGSRFFTDHFGVMLVNEEDQVLETHPSYQGLQREDRKIRIPIGSGITGLVAQSNHLIHVEDVSSNLDYIGPSTPHSSELCVPISVNGKVFGVINAESSLPGAFSTFDERLLGTVADQLALSLQKSRLYQVEKKRRLEAEASRNASSILTTSLDLDEVLDNILVNLRKVIDSDQASIHLFMDDHVQIVAGNGFDTNEEMIGFTYPFSDPLLQEIVETNQPLVLEDINLDSRYVNFGFGKPRAWMGIPLIEKGTLFGILAIDSNRSGTYDQSDARIGQIFADNAAAAIVKARLFETERKHRLEAEIQQDISLSLTNSEDLATASGIFLEKIKRYLKYDTAGIFLEENGHLKIVATHGFPEPEKLDNLRVSKDNRVYQEMIKNKSFLIFEDISTFEGFEDYGAGVDIRGWMGVPLIDQGIIYGYVSFDSITKGKFTTEMGQLAQVLVNQTSSAITKAKLFEETQLGLKRMSALHEVDRIITSSVDLSFAAKKILQICADQLNVDALQVSVYDNNSFSFIPVSSLGIVISPFSSQRDYLETGMAEQVALDREIIYINDLEGGDSLPNRAVRESYKSYMGVPLIAKGAIIGVLEIFNRSELQQEKDWEEFVMTLATQLAIAMDNSQMFEKLQKSHLELSLAYDSTIEGWAQALELRDMETEGHSRRVVDMTMDLARMLGIDNTELVHIRRGALLHDIGKMAIPDAILQKTGKLTDEEWEIMRQHPVYSQEWLSSTEYLKPALDIPYSHHEKWDGTGYPQGLKGEEIPRSARIFAIVDVYDALRSDRPYRKAWSKNKTLNYIQEESGKHFDPEVVEAFLEMMKTYQPERLMSGVGGGEKWRESHEMP